MVYSRNHILKVRCTRPSRLCYRVKHVYNVHDLGRVWHQSRSCSENWSVWVRTDNSKSHEKNKMILDSKNIKSSARNDPGQRKQKVVRAQWSWTEKTESRPRAMILDKENRKSSMRNDPGQNKKKSSESKDPGPQKNKLCQVQRSWNKKRKKSQDRGDLGQISQCLCAWTNIIRLKPRARSRIAAKGFDRFLAF